MPLPSCYRPSPFCKAEMPLLPCCCPFPFCKAEIPLLPCPCWPSVPTNWHSAHGCPCSCHPSPKNWLSTHGCPCSCLPSIPCLLALCPWLVLLLLDIRPLLRLSAHGYPCMVVLCVCSLPFPAPDGAKLSFPAPDGAVLVKCAAQPIMRLVSCCCRVPCWMCHALVVVVCLVGCVDVVRLLLLCGCCCCAPVVVVRLVGCVGVLLVVSCWLCLCPVGCVLLVVLVSCLRPVCVLFASCWLCSVGRLLLCGCYCRASFVWLLVCLFCGKKK